MALTIPSMILKRLYTFGSLENTADGYQFNVKNRLSDAELTELIEIKIDKQTIDNSKITLSLGDGRSYKPAQITTDNPLPFPLRQIINIHIQGNPLPEGKHDIELSVRAKPFGKLKFSVDDAITEITDHLIRIPRDDHDDYSEDSIKKRQEFVAKYTGHTLQHIPHYSFDPHITAGNIEHFTGVAQIPIRICIKKFAKSAP